MPVRDPIFVLMQDPDPFARSRAHATLGQRAAQRNDISKAVQHHREALAFDPNNEHSRDALRLMGSPTSPHSTEGRGFWSRFRRMPAS